MDNQTENKTYNPILEGVIWKQLLIFFFPILLGSFFQQMYNTVDSLIVGNFVGTEALAAVGGSTALIVNLIVGFFMGLSAGGGIIISQYYGAGNQVMVDKAIHTAYAFSIVGGLLVSVVCVFLSPKILILMNQPEDIMAPSTTYLQIYFAGLVFIFVYNIGSGILRALGDSKRPLYFLIICSVVNVVLDLVLVLWLGLGVAGVAIATVIAQAVSAVLTTLTLMRGVPGCKLELRKLRIDPYSLKKQMALGVPTGVQSTMYAISNMIAQRAVNSYGTAAVAGWTADGKIESMYWMITAAFGIALITFVGQNYGAGRMDRVKKGTFICLGMDIAASLLIGFLMHTFATPLLGIFTKDAEALRIGTLLMKTVSPFYFGYAFVEAFSGMLKGMGEVLPSMIMVMAVMCFFRIGWLVVVQYFFHDIMTIIVVYPVTWCLGGFIFILYYLVRRKKYFG